jgi:type II secretory pathway component PulF
MGRVGIPLSAVYRNLAAYHRAGAPWPEAVDGSASGDAWREAADRLRRGDVPSEALAAAVPALDVAGLRAAETSGRMEEALSSLAELHAGEERRRRERRAAMAYPFLLAHIGALLLPFPDLVRGRPGAALGWAVLALLPIYVPLALGALARRGKAKAFLSKASVEEADARALRAFGWLHDAGVPYSEALGIAARAGEGGRVARDLGRAEVEVAGGRPLAAAWQETPPDVRSRLLASERTGTLAAALAESAETLEHSAEMRRRRLASVLPPVIVLGMGLVVAWRVIDFYGGYFSRLR